MYNISPGLAKERWQNTKNTCEIFYLSRSGKRPLVWRSARLSGDVHAAVGSTLRDADLRRRLIADGRDAHAAVHVGVHAGVHLGHAPAHHGGLLQPLLELLLAQLLLDVQTERNWTLGFLKIKITLCSLKHERVCFYNKKCIYYTTYIKTIDVILDQSHQNCMI